jgi:hypothetical protein
MKVIVYKKGGQVRIGKPQPQALALLTTKSPAYAKHRAERDIALQVEHDGRSEEDLRPYYDGLVKGNLTEEQALAVIARKDALPGETWRIAEEDQIPQDRTFRDAWTDDQPTDTVDIDMPKARAIRMHQLRHLRNERLKALDAESVKALESGTKAEQKAVAEKKQALRDMPQNTDLSTIESPEELAAFVPEILV